MAASKTTLEEAYHALLLTAERLEDVAGSLEVGGSPQKAASFLRKTSKRCKNVADGNKWGRSDE